MTLILTPEVQLNKTYEYAKSAVLSVMGFDITFQCESDEIYDVLHEIYAPSIAGGVKAGIVVYLKPSVLPDQDIEYPPRFEVNKETFRAKSGATHFIADRKSMMAEAYICKRMLQHEYTFRHQVLNAISYYLLSAELVTPIHGCAFVLNRKLFICLGKSGAGKSTLAMAAYCRGLPVMAEDLCFLTSTPSFLPLFDCREIHLLPNSVEKFPMLKEHRTSRTHNGKIKYIVHINNNPSESEFDKLTVLYINPRREQQGTELVKYSKALFDDLFKKPEDGFNLSTSDRAKHIDWLASHPAYRADIGNNINHFFESLGDIRE